MVKHSVNSQRRQQFKYDRNNVTVWWFTADLKKGYMYDITYMSWTFYHPFVQIQA
jgi:hypothetical protein